MNGARALTDQEIENVFNALNNLRDKSLWTLGIKTGLRISELLSLNISNILEFGKVGSQVNIAKRNTKGKVKSRNIDLTVSAKAILQEYLDSLGAYDPNQPLFKSTKENKAISRVQAHKILKKAFNELEMEGSCSTHSMRKSYCYRVHKAMGERIEYTKEAMGHASIISTSKYIEIDQEVVRRAILAQG